MSQEEVKDFVDRYMPAYIAYRSEIPDIHICDSGAMSELMETMFQIYRSVFGDGATQNSWILCETQSFFGGMT